MLTFDPDDPFPLLAEDSHSYAEAQAHAAQVDAWLGLAISECEAKVGPAPGHELWNRLDAQSFLTPYTELRAILERLRPPVGGTVVDLGAAYGRMGFVIARNFPKVNFIGFEIDHVRVQEGRRLLPQTGFGRKIDLIQADLTSPEFVMPKADAYFIYDYGTREAVEKTIEDLRQIARTRRVSVAGRGGRVRDVIEKLHPWLSQVVSPEHFARYSIYRSAPY